MSIHTRLFGGLLALAVCTTLTWSAAQAADGTRYVSTAGKNANDCTLAAPCRTLQRGINVTPPGGELRILDSGFYGNNADIKKSMTIASNGNTVYLGSSVRIEQAEAVVALRDLVLSGQGTVLNGISVFAAARVHIEGCVVHGFADNGIAVDGAQRS